MFGIITIPYVLFALCLEKHAMLMIASYSHNTIYINIKPNPFITNGVMNAKLVCLQPLDSNFLLCHFCASWISGMYNTSIPIVWIVVRCWYGVILCVRHVVHSKLFAQKLEVNLKTKMSLRVLHKFMAESRVMLITTLPIFKTVVYLCCRQGFILYNIP